MLFQRGSLLVQNTAERIFLKENHGVIFIFDFGFAIVIGISI